MHQPSFFHRLLNAVFGPGVFYRARPGGRPNLPRGQAPAAGHIYWSSVRSPGFGNKTPGRRDKHRADVRQLRANTAEYSRQLALGFAPRTDRAYARQYLRGAGK